VKRFKASRESKTVQVNLVAINPRAAPMFYPLSTNKSLTTPNELMK